MTRLSTRAVNFLFPPTCPVTGEELGIGGGALSATAWGDLAILTGPRCFTCGREVPGDGRAEELCCDPCLRRPPLWTRGRAAFRYEGTGRRLVLSIKHGDRLDLVPMVARFMIQAGPDLVAEADWIAPVPLHWTRMIKRRSNQAAELARRISVIAGRRSAYAPGLLRRIRRTGSQDGRSRAGREANMAGAFGLMPGAERSGAGATQAFHPSVAARYQAEACKVTEQTIEAFGRNCNSGQRPCSDAAMLSTTGDAGYASAVGADANSCFSYTSGSAKLVGCQAPTGFQIVHIESLGAVQ